MLLTEVLREKHRREMEKLLELASINSIWRGKDYCEGHMVQSWSKTSPTTYEGTVASKNEPETVYHVSLDREHPKRSTCDCPFANGRRVICKHMVALFFTAEPGFLEKFIFEEEALEREE